MLHFLQDVFPLFHGAGLYFSAKLKGLIPPTAHSPVMVQLFCAGKNGFGCCIPRGNPALPRFHQGYRLLYHTIVYMNYVLQGITCPPVFNCRTPSSEACDSFLRTRLVTSLSSWLERGLVIGLATTSAIDSVGGSIRHTWSLYSTGGKEGCVIIIIVFHYNGVCTCPYCFLTPPTGNRCASEKC